MTKEEATKIKEGEIVLAYSENNKWVKHQVMKIVNYGKYPPYFQIQATGKDAKSQQRLVSYLAIWLLEG